MKNEKGEIVVYIDGVIKPQTEVDPAKHTFIGNFRNPTPPCSDPTQSHGGYFQCDCGALLSFREDIRRHWYEGHQDIPQYKTI